MQKNGKKNTTPPLARTVLLRTVVFCLLFFAAAFFAWWAYDRSGWWPIRRFEVVPAAPAVKLDHISTGLMIPILEPYRQENNLLKIDLTALETKLRALPWVGAVNIIRVWPDTVRIIISERIAAARWGAKGGFLVDTAGNVFAGVSPAPLVILAGPADTAREVLAFYREIASASDNNVPGIRAVELTERSSWVVLLSDGSKVYLDYDSARVRWQGLIRIWRQLQQGDSRKIKHIHLEYRRDLAVEYES